MRTPHSTFTRGKRIRIVTRGGEIIVARFIEKRRNGTIVLEGDSGRVDVEMKHVRSCNIFKNGGVVKPE